MTVDSLTAPAPPAHRTHCCDCHRPTAAAIAVRWIHTASGPGHTLYACPHCAPTLTPGPTPDELGRQKPSGNA